MSCSRARATRARGSSAKNRTSATGSRPAFFSGRVIGSRRTRSTLVWLVMPNLQHGSGRRVAELDRPGARQVPASGPDRCHGLPRHHDVDGCAVPDAKAGAGDEVGVDPQARQQPDHPGQAPAPQGEADDLRRLPRQQHMQDRDIDRGHDDEHPEHRRDGVGVAEGFGTGAGPDRSAACPVIEASVEPELEANRSACELRHGPRRRGSTGATAGRCHRSDSPASLSRPRTSVRVATKPSTCSSGIPENR